MDKILQHSTQLALFCQKYMALKNKSPIRPSELIVLDVLVAADEPYTPWRLAETLQVSKPMITAHIISLNEKGYIVKAECDYDRRTYYVCPTKKARALVERKKEEMYKQYEYLSEKIGAENLDEFARLAGMIGDALDLL